MVNQNGSKNTFLFPQVSLQRSKPPSWLKPGCKVTDCSFGSSTFNLLTFPHFLPLSSSWEEEPPCLCLNYKTSTNFWAITPLLKSASSLPSSPKLCRSCFLCGGIVLKKIIISIWDSSLLIEISDYFYLLRPIWDDRYINDFLLWYIYKPIFFLLLYEEGDIEKHSGLRTIRRS